jgi:hypothetical protein
MSSDRDSTQPDLAGLAAFLPIFEAEDFDFGQWSSTESGQPGVVIMPMFMLSEAASAFHTALHDLGWVRFDFDWVAWQNTPESESLRGDPDAIANATPDQLAKLLTMIVRADRFCEGALLACYKSGLFLRILRRVSELSGASTP